MNPLILRWGIGVIVAVVVCVATYRASRRQQAQLQPTYSSFDGSDITVCCICLDQLSAANESGLVRLPCKHKFHRCCIKTVFSAETVVSSCPLCRRTVDSAVVTNILQRTDF